MGWIFSPHSIRQIDQNQAAAFIQEIKRIQPSIQHVGVFAANSVKSIVDLNEFLIKKKAALDYLQVVESIEFVAQLRKATTTPVIPVIRPTQKLSNADFEPTAPSAFYVVDRYDPVEKGGTGKQIDADFFAPVRFQFLVAGGINPTNAVEILKLSDAWGIDLSSGVESKPGKKEKTKLELLFRSLSNV